MRRLMVVLMLGASVLGGGACASGGSGGAVSGGSTTDAPSLAGGKTAAEQKAQIDNGKTSARSAQCTTDRQTIEIGIQAYRAMNDAAPTTMADLVPELLKEASELWELGPVGPDGNPTVVPTEAGVAAGCRAEG